MSTKAEETLSKIDEQMAQLQARRKKIENGLKQKKKNERTRLLIQFGELIESYLKFETPEQLETWLKQTTNQKDHTDPNFDRSTYYQSIKF